MNARITERLLGVRFVSSPVEALHTVREHAVRLPAAAWARLPLVERAASARFDVLLFADLRPAWAGR
jgi:hypothetical protein